MSSTRWRRLWLAAGLATGLAVGATRADAPTGTVGAEIVLREPGKPDRKCVIEKTNPQADGTHMHEVRDTATGERMRVVDGRKSERGVFLPGRTVWNKPPARRVPTTAELAAHAAPAAPSGVVSRRGDTLKVAAASEQSVLQTQVRKLMESPIASDRESAAMALTLSDSRTAPEVVEALMVAGTGDPAAVVRLCAVRCLYRLAPEAPQVVPAIKAMLVDSDEEVRRTAALAVQKLAENK